jgi:CubicO group peptidase (beta-lactamase class C family)
VTVRHLLSMVSGLADVARDRILAPLGVTATTWDLVGR